MRTFRPADAYAVRAGAKQPAWIAAAAVGFVLGVSRDQRLWNNPMPIEKRGPP